MRITDDKVKSGFLWSLIGRVGNQGISFLIFAVLSRLLTVDDFGILALTMVVIELAIIISNFGWETTIVQSKELLKDEFNAILTFATIISFLLAVIVFICAGIISEILGVVEVAIAIKILCLLIIISPIHISFNAIFKKELDLKTVSIRDLLASIIAGSIAIIMALNGFGFLSLVYYYLLVRVVSVLVIYPKLRNKPQIHFDFNVIKHYAKFSIYVFLSNMIKYGKSRIVDLIIHYNFGLHDLGIFSIGMKLIEFITKLTQQIVTSVIFPYFSIIQTNLKLVRDGINTINKVCLWLMLPVTIFIFLFAKELILLTIGQDYLEASMILRFGSLLVLIRFINGNYNSILTALGEVKVLLIFRTIGFLAILGLLQVFKNLGIDYVVLSYVFGSFLLLPFIMMYLSKITLLKWFKRIDWIYYPLLFNILLFITLFFVKTITPISSLALIAGFIVFTVSIYFVITKHLWKAIHV